MSWEVEWTEQALREAGRLDRQVRQRVIAAIDRYAETERGDVRHLGGGGDQWRLRIGDWRVRFTFDRSANTMSILHVLPRGRAYRR
jgi:mRNA interferase RelE/StbE